jgi:hypothetical protein
MEDSQRNRIACGTTLPIRITNIHRKNDSQAHQSMSPEAPNEQATLYSLQSPDPGIPPLSLCAPHLGTLASQDEGNMAAPGQSGYVDDLLQCRQLSLGSGFPASGSQASSEPTLFAPHEGIMPYPLHAVPHPDGPPQRPQTPRIVEITPNEGDIMGGTEVAIIGTSFPPGLQFRFERRLATETRRLSEILYRCRSPGWHTAGQVQVRYDGMLDVQPMPTFTYTDTREKDL